MTAQQPDLFAAPTALAAPSNALLATPAHLLILASLPPGGVDEERRQLLVLADGSAPPPAIAGSMLEKWGSARRVLGELWRGVPVRHRPAALAMNLPPIDRRRRRKIEAIAKGWPWSA